MFYDHNQVEDLLNCSVCNQRYDKPLLLPCWKTICNKCVINRTVLDSDGVEKLNCPFCVKSSIIHEVPDQGFAVNDALNSLLHLKPVDVHRAELFKTIGDLLKKIQFNMNDLDNIEKNIKLNLYDYFEIIKNEIVENTQKLIDQATKYRDKLINQIEYLKQQSCKYFTDLFSADGSLSELKKKCTSKKYEWQTSIEKCSTTSADENKINTIIKEANLLNSKLAETKMFIQNSINNRKLVFNQAEPTYIENKLGHIDFQDQIDLVDHRLKVKLMNNLVKCQHLNLSDSDNLITILTTHLIPLVHERLILVSKSSYDDFSNIDISIIDMNGKLLAQNTDNAQSKINAIGSYSNYLVVSLTDLMTGRDIIKLYNSSLQLITSIITEFKCEQIYFNDSYVYTKLDANYPYCYKFDYNLVKQPMFTNLSTKTEIFVSFVVDKLIHFSSNTNRIYFNDKCFSRLKIYSESTGHLINSIHVDNLRDCSIRIDSALINSDQFLCFNKDKRYLRVYDASNASLLAENYLSDSVTNVTNFYLTKDGYYVFVDNLNDSVYFY
jgi:hypothetical protein